MQNRPLKTVKLSDFEVDIITSLTWGENEKIQSVMMSKVNYDQENLKLNFDKDVMLESKYALLENCIKEIRKGEEKMQFSRDWMNDLSIEDGNKLYNAVEELSKKK